MPGKLNLEVNADASKAIAELQKTVAKLEEAGTKTKELGTSGRKAGEDMSSSFTGMAKNLGSVLAGALSVGAAMSAITGEMQRQSDISRKSADGLLEEEVTRKRLLQISDFQADKFSRLLGLSEKVSKAGFTQAEAQAFVFTSLSAGLSEEETLRASRFRAFEAEDTKALPESIASLRAAFGPQVLGGDVEATMNAILVAAKESKVGASDIAVEVLQGVAAAKAQGTGPEELLGAFAILTRAEKSPEQAINAIRAFSVELQRKEEFKDIGIVGAIEKLGGLPEAERKTFIEGLSARAQKAASAGVQNIADIQRVTANIFEAVAAAGGDESQVRRLIEIGGRDPTLLAISGVRETAAGEQIATQEFGREQLQRTGIRQLREQTARILGLGVTGRALPGVNEQISNLFFDADVMARDPVEFAFREFPRQTQFPGFAGAGLSNEEFNRRRMAAEDAFVDAVESLGIALRESAETGGIFGGQRPRAARLIEAFERAEAREPIESPDVIVEE